MDILNFVVHQLGLAYQFTRIMQDSGTGPAVLEQIAIKAISQMVLNQTQKN